MSFMFINKEKGLRAKTNVDTQRISLIWTSAIFNLPLAISTNSDHFQRQSKLYVRLFTTQTKQRKLLHCIGCFSHVFGMYFVHVGTTFWISNNAPLLVVHEQVKMENAVVQIAKWTTRTVDFATPEYHKYVLCRWLHLLEILLSGVWLYNFLMVI